uniref:RING-type domain-containing protein n=1 Tax=Kalanchoe fedtschenkoi TaxID=63787 RepID=A0A7N0U2S6_KALFE
MGMSYEDKIALSRKIMTAGIVSLLAATILIVMLHIYAKCLLMRQERVRARAAPRSFSGDAVMPVDDDDQLSPGSSSRRKPGLDALTIASLPKFVYAEMKGLDEGVECAVCLGAVCGQEVVRMLPNCKHLFHMECVDKWLCLHTSCPICRTAAEPVEAHVEVGSASVGQSGSNSLLSSFRKLVSGERSSGRVQSSSSYDVENQ